MKLHPWSCGSTTHCTRRSLLQAAGLSGVAWLTPVAELLANEDAAQRGKRPAQSVILLWLSGGPSQLETFDPQAGTMIAGGTTSIDTAARNVQIASLLPRLAEEMQSVSLVRNVVTKEGDHQRAAYNVKSGYRPDPTIDHPSLGAIVCHQTEVGRAEIPRHISLLPDDWYGKGGYLGRQYDAFRSSTVGGSLPDMSRSVERSRADARLTDLDIVDKAFAQGRLPRLDAERTLHRDTIERAVRMMDSTQLAAFEIDHEPTQIRESFGDSDFGRGCLAALRLIDVGVRCVEVTLSGWDSHVNNHGIHENLVGMLDPAFAALLRQLRERDRLRDTVVICGGEFGRTPRINTAGGRDHWPHGFSIALAGGGIRGGQVVGETDSEGKPIKFDQGTRIEDVHATVLTALGIPPTRELDTPIGRPMKLSEGNVIPSLLS